ncbi:BCCT family transporter [Pedobacter aquatilis]|uniref:BCCT family transporter n=1 Tax=Pedobacter aquatilis TaxID=351343 RepID=UPI0025B52A15|nr:BCCT family transporter [Pedobacter aquatilis]MDN3588478.1 BCCT family transporter [Pedobacter aquatilis]
MISGFNIKTTFDKAIIIPGLIFIVGICLLSVILPNETEQVLNSIKVFIFVNLNWVYVWSVTIFVIFLVYLMFSKYGAIRLGDNDSKPEHSFFSWIAMLFAAGMGIGLMYFGVAEPLSHYANNVFDSGQYVNKAKNAQIFSNVATISIGNSFLHHFWKSAPQLPFNLFL